MKINKENVETILAIKIRTDFILEGIVENVEHVQKNYLFVVRKGNNYNSFDDIELAIQKQAIVVHEDKQEEKGYYVAHLQSKLENLMKLFYQDINQHVKVIGVCGSNGKSSVVSYLYDLLDEYPCMKIGTHFVSSPQYQYASNNTTPDCITLMHMFHIASMHAIKYIIMEVSSHAIDRQRIRFIEFDYIIYTNIARDHLDYHKTLIHYRYTKYKLTKYLKEGGAIIISSDELYYQELRKICERKMITYGQNAAHFQICDLSLRADESCFYVNRFYFRTYLLSMVNVYNVTACIALLRCLNIPYYMIYKKILMLRSKEGRLERIYHRHFNIYIDYAHTPNAFYEVLNYLNALKVNRLLVIVGCGGEREKKKREEIGLYASSLADICIFTEDNSRNEKTSDIIRDMCKRVKKDVVIIENRKEALQYAIKKAEKNDIILISGKGNEMFLEKKGEQIPFNDKDIILEMLGE